MQPDCHGDTHGYYTVTSLYYDTNYYKSYRDFIKSLYFRRKLRIRVYGEQTVIPSTPCFVEIKQQRSNLIQKKRVQMHYKLASVLCDFDQHHIEETPVTEQTTIQEVRYLSHTLKLKPTCIIRYRRLAFTEKDDTLNLRVTFDMDLTYRVDNLSLLSQNKTEYQMSMPLNCCIMEIKANGHIPYWLSKLAGKHQFRLQALSKYCTAMEQSGLLQNYSL